MFSSWDHLAHKTPAGSLNRLEYLQQLVTEFQTSKEQDSQEQVLANLANFAYDPINYEYMRQLNIIDLFLDMLTELNETLVTFGIGGLCNLALDKQNKEHILANDGVQQVVQCLSSNNEDIILSAITTLMFLVTPLSKSAITVPRVLLSMERFSHSSNSRISNLATVFLQDYCSKDQQQQAKALYDNVDSADDQSPHNITSPADIPLPSGPPPVAEVLSPNEPLKAEASSPNEPITQYPITS